MDLQTLNGKIRAVCFSKDRYIIFKELDESGEQVCMIRSYDTNDNDILINDCTKVSKIALEFNQAKDTVYSDIKSVINEFSLYTRVNIKGKITDLSVATENDVILGFLLISIFVVIFLDEKFADKILINRVILLLLQERHYFICKQTF